MVERLFVVLSVVKQPPVEGMSAKRPVVVSPPVQRMVWTGPLALAHAPLAGCPILHRGGSWSHEAQEAYLPPLGHQYLISALYSPQCTSRHVALGRHNSKVQRF